MPTGPTGAGACPHTLTSTEENLMTVACTWIAEPEMFCIWSGVVVML